MTRWIALAMCLGLFAVSGDGFAAESPPHVSKSTLVRAGALPTEDGFVWRPQLFFHAFRGDTERPCATWRSFAPRQPYGVGSRRYEWTSDDGDHIVLDAARSTVVRLGSARGAGRYYRRYSTGAFDCPRRDVDGDAGHATAVYRTIRHTSLRTVVVDKVRERRATTIARYIDVRRVGPYVAIVELDLGEDIDVKPDLRRVDAIADAQAVRLRSR
jgi:hypothetical protein